MNVMTVLGSPRHFGNTAQVLEWVEAELQAEGHTVDRANIWEYEVGHCRESHQCRYPESAACGTPDDAAALFERMLDADVVLFASPIFSWGFPAPLKALIDRLYCLSGFHEDPGHAIRLEGKRVALLMTCGGSEDENRQIMERVYRNMVAFWGAEEAGLWIVTDVTSPEMLGSDIHEKARSFAARMLGEKSRPDGERP